MKKLYIALMFLSIILFSCENNFDPYADFRDIYNLTLVLRSDTDMQVAVLSKSYRPDGVDPYDYTEDSSIKNAEIKVWYNDSVYFFKDSSVVRSDSSRYNFPFSFYYNNNFKVANNKAIEVEALLPNGRRLTATSKTPGEVVFNNQSEVLIPPVDNDLIIIDWNSLGEGTFYVPYLGIRYIQKVNGVNVEKVAEVPLLYYQESNESVFPIASNKTYAIYSLEAVTHTLNAISSQDPEKNNFSVYKKLKFDLIGYDQNLSRYVSSTSKSLDDLTVSINPAEYTNIEGGLGIFGSYTKSNYTRLRFDENYITSFGYNFINEN